MPTFATTIIDAVASTTVDFTVEAITTYWPYFLGISLIVGVAMYFRRLLGVYK